MKITIDLSAYDTNLAGEVLRGIVFDQSFGRCGCYSTFDVNRGFEEIDPKKWPLLFEPFKPESVCDSSYWGDGKFSPHVTAYESANIVAMWWWDGDGNLLIWVKGEPQYYVTFDCKKDYEWERKPL